MLFIIPNYIAISCRIHFQDRLANKDRATLHVFDHPKSKSHPYAQLGACPTTQTGRPKGRPVVRLGAKRGRAYFFAQERRPIGTITSEQMSVTT